MAQYIPEHGDVIALSFDPHAGHEPKGRRPALVISKHAFNRATKLAICCPLTKTRRGIPFHVPVPSQSGLSGFVMCEQLKSIDYRSRRAALIGKAPAELIDEVLAIIDAVIYP